MSDFDTTLLKQVLQQKPDHGLVLQDGSAVALLVGPEKDRVVMIVADTDTNFNDMSEDEINDFVTATLIDHNKKAQ